MHTRIWALPIDMAPQQPGRREHVVRRACILLLCLAGCEVVRDPVQSVPTFGDEQARPAQQDAAGPPEGETGALPDVTGSSEGSVDRVIARGTVAFVVGNSFDPAPSAGDRVLAMRISDRGYPVVFVDSPSTAHTDTALASLVVITSSSESGELDDRLKRTPSPVIVLESWFFGRMGMTGTRIDIDTGVIQSQRVRVVDDTHVAAGGKTGFVSVAKGNIKFNWGVSAGGTAIASLDGDASRQAIFAYETGSPLLDSSLAPGKRLGFFLRSEDVGSVTEEGLALFDAAVTWALR